MPLDFDEVKGNIVSVRAKGKLTDADYDEFVPRMEELIKQWGRLRMLFYMDDFHGWDVSGAWDEFKFELRHRSDLKRVAVVGDKKWAGWASKLSKLFTGTDVRYFEREYAAVGRAWIESGW